MKLNNSILDFIPKNVNRLATAGLINQLVKHYTGEYAQIDEYKDHVEIILNPDQKKIMISRMDEWTSGKPGPVRTNFGKGVLLPWALKKYSLYLLGVAGVGFIIGRVLR